MAGNGIYQIGLAWSVYQLTGSTAAMGLVLTASTVPSLAFVLVGGTLADRFPRRLVILVTDGAAALVTSGLAATSAEHKLSMLVLIAAAILLGTVTAFYRPAYSAMNRELVPENSFRMANVMQNVCGNIAYVAGPAVGGVAYGLGGSTLTFSLDAISFSIAVGAMLLTRTQFTRLRNTPHRLMPDLIAGLKYTVNAPYLALIILISMIANFACLAPYAVLLPELARIGDNGPDVLGFLTSTEVVITIIATIFVGRLRNLRAGPALLLLASAIGTGTLMLGFMAGHLATMLMGVTLIGVGMSYDVIEKTVIQMHVPEEVMSRVYSINMVASFGLLPFAYMGAGLLAHSIGVSWVLEGGGAILITSCLCAVVLVRGRLASNFHIELR